MARPRKTPEQDAMLSVLGGNLRRLREASELSQSKLGHAVGADQQYVREVEQGRVNVSATRLVELARELGIEPSELLAGM